MERSRPQNPEYYRMASCDLGLVKHFLGEPAPMVEVTLTVKDWTDTNTWQWTCEKHTA
jgi:hypothetical protein